MMPSAGGISNCSVQGSPRPCPGSSWQLQAGCFAGGRTEQAQPSSDTPVDPIAVKVRYQVVHNVKSFFKELLRTWWKYSVKSASQLTSSELLPAHGNGLGRSSVDVMLSVWGDSAGPSQCALSTWLSKYITGIQGTV